jgi:hypothetical protein
LLCNKKQNQLNNLFVYDKNTNLNKTSTLFFSLQTVKFATIKNHYLSILKTPLFFLFFFIEISFVLLLLFL